MIDLPIINELQRLPSPAPTPQALAWHKGELWFGSRDLQRIYRMDLENWKVGDEINPPGTPWAGVSDGRVLWFTLGEGAEDDRYMRRFEGGKGFSEPRACPDLTGSYLSYDGANLYLSQWYKHRILKLDGDGNVTREIAVGAEISGHAFVNGTIYVLCGTEQNGGDWRLARLNSTENVPEIKELARVPFQCRSLTYDGERLWTNHREADQIVCFAIPE
jgi:hypothetical protein